jgi:hypothetical protein
MSELDGILEYMAPRRTWTDEQLRLAVGNSRSYGQVREMLGLAPSGGSYRTIIRHVTLLRLDTTHFTGRSWERIGNPAPGHKICGKCGKEKPFSEFYRRGSGRQSQCKICKDNAGRDFCACGRLKTKRHERCHVCREEDKPPPRIEISSPEVAWVAGILEGEGCWTRKATSNRWWIAVRMTDEDLIRRLRTLTGVGTINIELSKRGHKTAWTWCVAVRSHREWLTLQVWPWLGTRRRARIRELWPEVEARSTSIAAMR